KGSGLGHNILGLEDDLKAFQEHDVREFIKNNYNTEEIVIGITGDYELGAIEKMLNRYFGPVLKNTPSCERGAVQPVLGQHLSVSKPINQVHYMLGSPAYG